MKILLYCLMVAHLIPTHAYSQFWLGIQNSEKDDLRLAELAVQIGKSQVFTSYYLGSLEKESDCIWFFLGDGDSYQIAGIRACVKGGLRSFHVESDDKRFAEMDIPPKVALKSKVSLIQITNHKCHITSFLDGKNLPEIKSIREGIHSVSLLSLLFDLETADLRLDLRLSIQEEKEILEKIPAALTIPVSHTIGIDDALQLDVHRKSYLNGYYSVLLSGVPESNIVAFQLHGQFLPPAMPASKAGDIIYKAFEAGRSDSKFLLEKNEK